MATALLSAVVLAGVVAGLNLVLTLGVIRRLKDHEQCLADAGTGGGDAPAAVPAPGTAVPEFAAVTTGGGRVTNDELGGGAYVGFFSVGCPPCAEQLPEFVRLLRGLNGEPALVVIESRTLEDAAAFLAVADGLPVVVDTGDGLCRRFGVTRFPSMLHLSDGVVSGNAHTVSRLLTQVPG
jgi:hypothetical protein